MNVRLLTVGGEASERLVLPWEAVQKNLTARRTTILAAREDVKQRRLT